MSIRTSTKAIIVAADAVLLVEKNSGAGPWFALPGGGQHHGETLIEALRRECREEIGHDICVGELLYVREYIGGNHEFAATSGEFHQVEFWFECALADADGGSPIEPDPDQTGVCWVKLADLGQTALYPKQLAKVLRDAAQPERSVYLGDIN
jgi:8-oxo-dGTP diphosphatase